MQVLLLLRQMECTTTQATASKVSLLMLGQQAVIDAYLCLLHLTTGEPHYSSRHTAIERHERLIAARQSWHRSAWYGL